MMHFSRIRHYFQKTSIQLVVLTILVLPTFISLIRPGFYPMQDDLQAFRILEMGKCFSDFQIPCQWIPDMGYQYGYPQFLFYSPSVYYLGAIIHLFGVQIIDVVKILFGLGFILGAFAMFGFLKSWLGTWAGFFGALLYTYVPFKAAQVFVRGSLSEFWAAIFFPLLFWFSMEYIRKGEKKYGIFFALSIFGLLITHNLMSFIYSPLLALWMVLWLFLEKKYDIRKLILSGVLGIGLSAFFILPLIIERQCVHTESLLGGYFDYRQHFVNLEQLFLSNYWGYGSSVLGDNDEVTLSTGILQWICALISLLLLFIYRQKQKKLLFIIGTLSFVELGVLFMMHQKSSFIWSVLPVLAWLQFPWRILSLSSFLLSLIGGVGIAILSKKINEKLVIGLFSTIFFLLLVLYGSFFSPREWFTTSDKEKFSGQSWEKQLTISIFDYLPRSATFPPNRKAPELPEILEGTASIDNYYKGSNWQHGFFLVTSDATIRLPMYDFPGMKVYMTPIGGDTTQKTIISHVNNDCRGEEYCFGLITINLPKGSYFLETKLTDTLDRVLGNIITVVSFFGLVGWALFYDKKKRN